MITVLDNLKFNDSNKKIVEFFIVKNAGISKFQDFFINYNVSFLPFFYTSNNYFFSFFPIIFEEFGKKKHFLL